MAKPAAKVEYLKNFPRVAKLQKSLTAQKLILIYDEKLKAYPAAAEFIQSFSDSLAVSAGESLKTLSSLKLVIPELLPMIQGASRQKTVLVALGGGSVGDFVGFVASILKRGVRLVHIPSTWLAAIDSAHGGKTALNVGEYKNQIGTFKEAERILIVRKLLLSQNEESTRAAMGELIKMALIAGSPLFAKLEKLTTPSADQLWSLLPLAVKAKYKVVKRDPFEVKGIRFILNLGHTLGHAYELAGGLPHGAAVAEGLKFALCWSEKLKLLRNKDFLRAQKVMQRLGPVVSTPALRPQQLRELLLQDKKSSGGDRLKFVLIKKPGQTVVKEFSVDQVVEEAVRQGVVQ